MTRERVLKSNDLSESRFVEYRDDMSLLHWHFLGLWSFGSKWFGWVGKGWQKCRRRKDNPSRKKRYHLQNWVQIVVVNVISPSLKVDNTCVCVHTFSFNISMCVQLANVFTRNLFLSFSPTCALCRTTTNDDDHWIKKKKKKERKREEKEEKNRRRGYTFCVILIKRREEEEK